MSAAAEAAWRDQVEKLIRWQQKVNKGDHAWRLNEEDPGEKNPFQVEAAKQFHGIECDVLVILAEDETRVKPRVRWEPRRDTLIGFCGQKVEHVCLPVPLHLLGSDCCEHFFSRVGGMSGCERNYDFGDLINCASGLNRLAALEFGKENLQLGGKHVKQETIWTKLHPRPVGQCEPDLASFAMLESDSEVVEALKTGLKEAQGCLIRLNILPYLFLFQLSLDIFLVSLYELSNKGLTCTF
ncbi:hypothetical protein R1sor_021287 [Riccia sorocarpa]|uniref:Uncharacterized protein n=1 Tax=Riccia sorocarpa TaxID=122646 RepID=A0ABD3GIA5_9MARC